PTSTPWRDTSSTTWRTSGASKAGDGGPRARILRIGAAGRRDNGHMRQAGSPTPPGVAPLRARESARPPTTPLFEDALAPAFLSRPLRLALRLSRLPVVGALVPWRLIDGHWTGSRGTVVARTRFIDDALGGALRSGAEQVVIFGAGFDTRAYRVAGVERAPVFQGGHPAPQGEKKRAIARRLRPLPSHVVFVGIDFDTDTLGAAMTRSGFRTGARTFFVCEGVTHYLSAPAVDAMFRYVAESSAPGSLMVFTYIH